MLQKKGGTEKIRTTLIVFLIAGELFLFIAKWSEAGAYRTYVTVCAARDGRKEPYKIGDYSTSIRTAFVATLSPTATRICFTVPE